MTAARALSRAVLTAVTVLLIACDSGPVAVGDPTPPTDTTGNGGGTVQRGTLAVTVSINPEDDGVAAAAGVGVSGLTVRLKRGASSDAPRAALTDATGRAEFTQLLQGSYDISVDRPLNATEIAALPDADKDATIFAGGATVSITPPSATASVSLVAARRGSLILSEVWFHTALVPQVGTRGMYVEVYNNSDTTVFLGGKILFETIASLHVQFSANPCYVNQSLREDDEGIWASLIHRFPGNATDYPLQPGQARVIATDALDHSPVAPTLQNLASAHFEFIGNSADPNNPFSDDMIWVSRNVFLPYGHSWMRSTMIGLALPVFQDTTELLREIVRVNGPDSGGRQSAFRIPRAAVLDVAGFRQTPAAGAGFECEPFTSAVFDRAPSRIADNTPLAIARKSLGRNAAGIEILQRTLTGSRDFEFASPLRRSLLKPPQ